MSAAVKEPGPAEKTIRVPWGPLAVLLAVLAPGAIWAGSLAISAFADTPDELSDSDVIFNVIAQIVLLDGLLVGIPAGVAILRHHAGWESLGLRSFDWKYWWWPIAATLGGLVFVYIYAAIAIGITGDAPEQEVEELFESRAVLPIVGFAVIVAAPVAEEIFFRGFLFPGLVRPLGAVWAIVASSLIFGMFHISNLETIGLVLPIGAVGALFAWLYYRTGSLWPSILSHMMFNTVGFTANALTAGLLP
jgi:membrane protease YdiL (CAAX protease family)